MSSLAANLAASARFVKWTQIGDTYTGDVVEVVTRQAMKFGTQTPDTWEDGAPKMQVVVVIATSEREHADDTGERAIVVNLWGGQRKALQAAVRDAGVPEPQPGQRFTASWESGAGGAGDPRVYRYVIDSAAAHSVTTRAADIELTRGTTSVRAPFEDTPSGSDWEPEDPVVIAQQMRRAGASPDVVASTVGLPVEVVERITSPF